LFVFQRQVGGKKVEAWIEGVKRCLSFQEYTSLEKAQMAMTWLEDATLIWWINEEKKLHLSATEVTWELFEERFISRYLSGEYKDQQRSVFHAVM